MSTPKRIGIDARLLTQTGVGTYIQNLIRELVILDTQNKYIIFCRRQDMQYIPSLSKNFEIRISNCRWHSLKEQVIFLWQIYINKIDLMHFTYFSHPIMYFGKFIITIHDLIPLQLATGSASLLPGYIYYLKLLVSKVVFWHGYLFAQKIIAPSKSVKADISKYFGKNDKIIVVYEGVEKIFTKKVTLENKKYILYVGNFYPHKNVDTLLNAYMSLKNPPKLVLKGPKDIFCIKMIELVAKSNQNHHQVEFMHTYLDRSQMAEMYQNALFLVVPSFAEGFGLPALEALSCGTRVIASNIAVHHEILEDNFLSFDPHSAHDLSQKIQALLANPNIIPKNRFDKDKFSFKKMAKETLVLYNVS